MVCRRCWSSEGEDWGLKFRNGLRGSVEVRGGMSSRPWKTLSQALCEESKRLSVSFSIEDEEPSSGVGGVVEYLRVCSDR